MRNFLSIVALAATFAIAGNAIAADLHWTGLQTTTQDSFGNVILDQQVTNASQFELGRGASNSHTIGNLYFAKSDVPVYHANQTVIDNFWVTTESINNFSNIFNNGRTANFNLLVGQKNDVSINGTNRTVGTATDPLNLGNVTLTGSSVQFNSGSTINADAPVVDENTAFAVQVQSGASINEATITGGTYNNAGTTTTAKLDGGAIRNSGVIDDLIYTSGTYTNDGGTIGKFTAAGMIDSNAGIGKVGQIEFADAAAVGSGFIITGIANGTNDVTYTVGANASEVNFAGADIQFNLTDSAFSGNFESGIEAFNAWAGSNEFSLDLGYIFGDGENDAAVSGLDALTSFIIGFGDWGDFTVFDGTDGWINGWGYSNDLITYIPQGGNGEIAPEPATLALVGLGLAGLGMVSRRRRK